MTRRQAALAISALLLAGTAAWGRGIQGPLSGYVFDETGGQIRPIRGLPGGAVVGPPVALPFQLKSASIAPGGYAIAVATTGELSVVSAMDTDEPAIAPFDALGTNPDAVVLNDAGTAAALYWKDKAAAQIVRGLPGSPVAGAIFDLSGIPGDIQAIVTDQAGSYLLVAAADSDGHGGIYRVASNDTATTVTFLVPAIRPTAIQLLHRGHDAIVADAGANQLLLIKDVAGNAEESILATSSDGVDAIDRLSASDDPDYVLAASSQNTKLMTLNLRDGFVSTVDISELTSVPSGLRKLSVPHLYLVNGPVPGPVQLLDNSRGISTYFVPPAMIPVDVQ